MKQKITLTIEPDILKVLQAYADATMQSRSRAVSMLILDAAKKQGVCADAGQQRQKQQSAQS